MLFFILIKLWLTVSNSSSELSSIIRLTGIDVVAPVAEDDDDEEEEAAADEVDPRPSPRRYPDPMNAFGLAVFGVISGAGPALKFT